MFVILAAYREKTNLELYSILPLPIFLQRRFVLYDFKFHVRFYFLLFPAISASLWVYLHNVCIPTWLP